MRKQQANLASRRLANAARDTTLVRKGHPTNGDWLASPLVFRLNTTILLNSDVSKALTEKTARKAGGSLERPGTVDHDADCKLRNRHAKT